ncbi:hypothetical protein [uncultured Xanthomonas sp.]|uniref:hypothetical protein n=1 Tax=uncultured Xanthomonas sp. TaxID=152831 RepID=UPI0025F510F9|nr:hypothetical protein [uncultured Xanthomonas sp.]
MYDYSQVFVGLSVLAAVAALLGAGVLMAAPDFARWLTDKVATFFSDSFEADAEDVENDLEDYDADTDVDWKCQPCQECGEEYLPMHMADGVCANCYDYSEG